MRWPLEPWPNACVQLLDQQGGRREFYSKKLSSDLHICPMSWAFWYTHIHDAFIFSFYHAENILFPYRESLNFWCYNWKLCSPILSCLLDTDYMLMLLKTEEVSLADLLIELPSMATKPVTPCSCSPSTDEGLPRRKDTLRHNGLICA